MASDTQMKRAKKTNPAQYKIYVDFLISNPQFVANKLSPSFDKDYFSAKWEELTNLLNSCGHGPNRPTESWMKKNQTKAKARKQKAHTLATGGGPALTNCLTEVEQKALGVWGLGSIDGHPDLEMDIGLNYPIEKSVSNEAELDSVNVDPEVEDIMPPPEFLDDAPRPPMQRRRTSGNNELNHLVNSMEYVLKRQTESLTNMMEKQTEE
ncbi:uncharacterized protein LOC113381206 [Ctenocephalides felis]|uniref:uncharacterized protein LOC113380594 n=1 Tax=Ctenocephalides felis TaxID=7515 RepID=UPI000E6E5B23|nr:uncharacterized protein LOC113380594 [Ctenocephalides felis]XP_026475727.1 uncharacterized protein LOC113380887 [Ctenocephalides felis]XP_026475955.1 uncharacterized protein LOC113381206 [Ctenocephalides felis]